MSIQSLLRKHTNIARELLSVGALCDKKPPLILMVFGLLSSFMYTYRVERVYGGEMADDMKEMQEHLYG